MLLRYFGFAEEPFVATPDPGGLYYSGTHREALASLKYGFYGNRGFTALIAPPGMGKTTLLFRFLEDIRDLARTVFLFDIDSQCEPRELIGYMLRDMGIAPGQDGAEMHEQLNSALISEARAGRKFVVVIDEAQNLSDAVLEKVRLLTNFETARAKLMQIVLAAQPQLSDKLLQPSLLQLRQRISTICRLEPFSTEETHAYINHRLKLAGYSGEPLFTQEALNLITNASHGIPRTINTLCFNALSLCRSLQSKQVNASMAAEVITDQQLIPESRTPLAQSVSIAADPPDEPAPMRRLTRRWTIAVALSLVVLAAGALGFSELSNLRAHKTDDVSSLDLKIPPASITPQPEANSGNNTAAPTPEMTPFEIIVAPKQTLGDIAKEYLGSFDLKRLHQIQALNPKLIDPDRIKAGQKISLPAPQATLVAQRVTPQPNIRTAP